MDGLIALLVVIAIVNALTSGKRKKRQETQRRAFQGARQAQAAAQAQMPRARPARQKPRPEPRAATPEELRAHLAAMEAGAELAPKRGEGSVSTQGESEAEHAEHRLRAAAEEAARRQEHEALRELRAANRDKLRTAVVMSEVLGKPVSLRPRTGYHR